MTRNWRGKAARIQWYFAEGSGALTQLKQVLYIGAALKILEVPLWMIVVASPFIYIVHVVIGYWWVKHGWFKHIREVSAIDAVAPIEMWMWYMNIRMFKHLGLPFDAMNLKEMPPELKHVLASFQQGAK